MKALLLSLVAASLMLTGCFETTQEITLKEDGSGTVSTTNDLSTVLGLAKNMGGGEDMEKMLNEKVDSTFSMASTADTMPGLSPQERDMLRKGSMYMKINGKEDKFLTRMDFPFTSLDEIEVFNKLTGKVMMAKLKDIMASGPMGGGGGADPGVPEMSSFDSYYDFKFEKGELKRSLNKEKYANAQNDEYLKGMKETAAMGIPVTATYIINLPSPATKVDGKNVVLSEDKKKVTVKVSIDDFFDNPEKLEYKVKY